MYGAQRVIFCFIALCFALSGCSESNNVVVTGKGSIRAIHAIPDLGTVSFLIEETLLGTLNYKDSSGTSDFDDLEYTFNFDTLLPGDSESTRFLTHTLQVDTDQQYTFVITGSLANPVLTVWQEFGRDWQTEIDVATDNGTNVTVTEVSFANIASDIDALDFYLEAPGTSPVAAAPRGASGNNELTLTTELPAGSYQLVLTPAGDPNTILFASDPIDIFAATSNVFAVMDSAGLTTAEFSVRWVGSGLGTELFDLNVDAKISAYHAALGTDAIDVVAGDDFQNPVASNLSFANSSTYASIDPSTINLNITPAGNPGVFLAERELTAQPGTFYRLYTIGLPGLIQTVAQTETKRTLSTHARLQVFQGAARFQTLDVYVVDLDTDISLIAPSLGSFLFGTGSGYSNFAPGTYTIVVTEPGSKTIIGGPYEIGLNAGQNYGVVVVDANDITSTNIQFFDPLAD